MSEQFDKYKDEGNGINDGNIAGNNTADNAGSITPPQYSYTPEQPANENDPVMLRRKIKTGYGWSGLSMIVQYVIINVVVAIFSMVVSTSRLTEYMAANPGLSQQDIQNFTAALTQEMMSDMLFLLVATISGYLIANVSSTLIATGTLKAFKVRDFFGKSKVSGSSVFLAAITILGIQALSIYAQVLVSNITGFTGVDETTSSLLSISDNMTTNILLVVYTVIIAPITEELLMRGYILNALSPVSRKFGIIASSILFGLMHGNFNQMVNGFLLGLLLGYIAVKSGSVKASIICHMAANLNAMFASAFFEYKLVGTMGEEFAMNAEMIYFAVLLAVGVIAAVLLRKRLGKITEDDCIVSGYSFSMEKAEEKKLTWKLLLTRPSFWIITAIYMFTAIQSITAVS